MDSLGSLNAFVQAAEARSFTVAGRPLTHPLVRSRLTAGGKWIRTLGPLRRATPSELSVPPAVNAVGARLPRKRPGVSAVGLASRSSIMLPSPRALRGAEPFGPPRES